MDPRWFQAQTLHERLSLLRAHPDFAVGSRETGQRRLERWKKSLVFSHPDLYEKFLSSEKITEIEFERALSLTGEEIQQLTGAAPDWLERLLALLKQPPNPNLNLDGYLNLVAPLIGHYYRELQTQARAINSQAFDSHSLVDHLTQSILARLRRHLQKTMVLETNIARLEDRLEGTSPEERYTAYIRQLHKQPELREAILLEYPVLARKCLMLLDQWLVSAREFLQRLHADHAVLQATFKVGRASKVTGGAGDQHRQGRSVHIVEFDNKTKIVYKPRPLASDIFFKDLIEWLNDQGLTPDLRSIRVLDRGEYGWTEFVQFAECTDMQQVERFYQRQGAWLAVLYAVGATDLHLENLIAHGEHPVVIDLETVFHASIKTLGAETSEELARQRLFDSVMAIGLLPQPTHGSGRSMDKSALGATPHQSLPFDVDGLENIGTDEVRVAKVPGRIGEIHSQPRLNGQPLDMGHYHAQIETGFTSAYGLLQKVREELQLRLKTQQKIPLRTVIRPSSFYASLLAELQHPTYNRNAMDQEMVLKDLWLMAKDNPFYERTIASEKAQLQEGDIPYFSTLLDSRDLDGVVESALAQSGIELASQRLARLSDEDRLWQLWLFDAAMATALSSEARKLRRPGLSGSGASFLEGAIAVGERLLKTAVRHKSSAMWVCLNYQGGQDLGANDHHYQVGLLGDDFYRGSTGVSLFLAYLHQETGQVAYRELAEEALNGALSRLEGLKAKKSPGAYSGLGGIIYVLQHLAALWNRPELLNLAVAQLDDLAPLIEGDRSLDLIAGCAGCIPILLSLHSRAPESSALALAKACGEKLLQAPTSDLYVPRGFSHGLSGVAWALNELAAATGDARFAEASAKAVSEEEELLGQGLWTDIPNSPNGMAWCHGPPGIALSRLLLLERSRDPLHRASADRALKLIMQNPRREDHILCHGALGNLEPFLLARGIPEYNAYLQEQSAAILKDIAFKGWMSPLPPQVIEPGIMIGLAGIGYGLLRLSAPERIPSILTLERPKSSSPS